MRIARFLALFLVPELVCPRLFAQDAAAGVTMPVTLTVGAAYASQPPESQAGVSASGAMFRATFNPSFKLGDKWFGYSALQVSSFPALSYGNGDAQRTLRVRLLQAFLGYIWTGPGRSLTLKAGELPSAFGSFSLRYDDMVNPLQQTPLSYGSPLLIRADQLPCGVRDFVDQAGISGNYGDRAFAGVRFRCGGSKAVSAGLVPVTLYSLPGAQMDLSWGKVDARFQLANSSPVNPQTLWSPSQALQWAAGAGYTIRQGFRIGFSTHRGPFLDHILTGLLPDRARTGDYLATGAGVDLQWSHGRWNLEAEWQRFQYDYPQFNLSPAVSCGYMEMTRTLFPRIYAAARIDYRRHNRIEDLRITSAGPFLPGRQSAEFAIGYRPNSRQLLKFGVTWLRAGIASPALPSVTIGAQLTTRLPALSKSRR